jgi:hypothetical protein
VLIGRTGNDKPQVRAFAALARTRAPNLWRELHPRDRQTF